MISYRFSATNSSAQALYAGEFTLQDFVNPAPGNIVRVRAAVMTSRTNVQRFEFSNDGTTVPGSSALLTVIGTDGTAQYLFSAGAFGQAGTYTSTDGTATLTVAPYTGPSDVVYEFSGSGRGTPIAFRLVAPDFINPPLANNSNVQFSSITRQQLASSTNVSANGVTFSNQSVLRDHSAQLTVDCTNNTGFAYFFPTGAFGTTGVYTAVESNPGTLTVTRVVRKG